MKPTTKKERRVAELSATLPILRPADEEWINQEFKRMDNSGLGYYVILERCHEFQVIRYYFKSRVRLFEIMQIWLNETEECVLSQPRFMRVDGWLEKGMSFRHIHKYAVYSYLGDMRHLPYSGVKIRSLLPKLHRAGLRTSLHRLNPYELCKALLKSNRIETLFKLRQYTLVYEFYSRFSRHDLNENMWQSIRVALRHGYRWDNPQEISDWCDMIRDLECLGLDTRNPHYICPADLQAAHTHWTERRHRMEEAKRLEEEKAEVLAYEPIFYENRKQFLGMVFRDKKIEVSVIPTAMGIKEEGIAMHHCVGGYYNRLNSLILSAKIDGKRIETIEVDLTDYHLEQSRGLQNKSTHYHKRIVDLVNANMEEIRIRNTKHKIAV